jgi:hypothetical protein
MIASSTFARMALGLGNVYNRKRRVWSSKEKHSFSYRPDLSDLPNAEKSPRSIWFIRQAIDVPLQVTCLAK